MKIASIVLIIVGIQIHSGQAIGDAHHEWIKPLNVGNVSDSAVKDGSSKYLLGYHLEGFFKSYDSSCGITQYLRSGYSHIPQDIQNATFGQLTTLYYPAARLPFYDPRIQFMRVFQSKDKQSALRELMAGTAVPTPNEALFENLDSLKFNQEPRDLGTRWRFIANCGTSLDWALENNLTLGPISESSKIAVRRVTKTAVYLSFGKFISPLIDILNHGDLDPQKQIVYHDLWSYYATKRYSASVKLFYLAEMTAITALRTDDAESAAKVNASASAQTSLFSVANVNGNVKYESDAQSFFAGTGSEMYVLGSSLRKGGSAKQMEIIMSPQLVLGAFPAITTVREALVKILPVAPNNEYVPAGIQPYNHTIVIHNVPKHTCEDTWDTSQPLGTDTVTRGSGKYLDTAHDCILNVTYKFANPPLEGTIQYGYTLTVPGTVNVAQPSSQLRIEYQIQGAVFVKDDVSITLRDPALVPTARRAAAGGTASWTIPVKITSSLPNRTIDLTTTSIRDDSKALITCGTADPIRGITVTWDGDSSSILVRAAIPDPLRRSLCRLNGASLSVSVKKGSVVVQTVEKPTPTIDLLLATVDELRGAP
jgi:hypothetical protein